MAHGQRIERIVQFMAMVGIVVATGLVIWNNTASWRKSAPPPLLNVGDRVPVTDPSPQLIAIERHTCVHCQELKPTLETFVLEARASGVETRYRSVITLTDEERAFAAGIGFRPDEIGVQDQATWPVRSVPLVVLVVDGRVRWLQAGSKVTDANLAAFRAVIAGRP